MKMAAVLAGVALGCALFAAIFTLLAREPGWDREEKASPPGRLARVLFGLFLVPVFLAPVFLAPVFLDHMMLGVWLLESLVANGRPGHSGVLRLAFLLAWIALGGVWLMRVERAGAARDSRRMRPGVAEAVLAAIAAATGVMLLA